MRLGRADDASALYLERRARGLERSLTTSKMCKSDNDLGIAITPFVSM